MVERAIKVAVLWVLFALLGAALGQDVPTKDSDSDGIPDLMELKLGTDPNLAEKLELVWEGAASDEKQRETAYTPSRDIRKMFLGNVAGNRWLWVLEFAANYEFHNTNLTLFVDADNNPKYGQKQKDVMGTDFVLWLSDGGRCCHGYSPTGEGAAPAPTRFAWLGNRVYFCTDMPILQEEGKTRCRALARCEVLEPRAEVSSTGWVAIAASPQNDRPKPRMVALRSDLSEESDSDHDGLPDAAEERLLTDPKTPERLDVIYDSATAPDAANRKKKLAAAPERTVSRILFGNVAGDRFLWCIEFGADYPPSNSNFILYLDADNDPKSGRRDMPGVDFMLGVAEGNAGMTAFAPNGEVVSGPANRVVIIGKRLYLCADIPLKQEGGRSVFRATALSETRNPAKGVDSTGWFSAQGAGISERKKSFSIDDVTESEGVEMTRGLDLFRALKEDAANVVVKIGNCEFEGFEHDTRTEYKEPSALRSLPGGRIYVTVPKDGRYHFGFLLYDQAGAEKVEIRRGNQRLGVAVADEDDRRTKLFFTKAPYEFKAGETVELRTAMAPGSYRIEDIIFLAKTAEVRPRLLEISDLEATPVWEGDAVKPGMMRVTWITTWPAKCTVKYGEQGGELVQEVTENEEFANHRVYLEGLKPNTTYQLRIIAPKPKGGEVTSDAITFSTAPPVVKATTERGTVALKVLNPSADKVTDWPVTSGVPFPQGALDSVAHMRLLGPDGKERTLQAQSLARWPDGSVKWALLSFRADVPAGGSAEYTLEYGSKVQPAPAKTGLSVTEEGDGVVIFTGPMKIELRKSQLALPGKVWLDKNGDGQFDETEIMCTGGEGKLIGDDGKEYNTLVPVEEMVVEERGPERACVLLKGHHVAKDGAKHFAYEVRLMAYAGQKFMRIFHTFGNDVLKSEFTSVRSLNLMLPLARGTSRFELGGEAPPIIGEADKNALGTQSGDTKSPVSIFQDFDDHYTMRLAGRTIEGRRAAGWTRATGPAGTMTVAVRDFWRLYPKSLSVDGDGIAVGLMPPLKEDQYAEKAKDPEMLVHLFYNLMDGRYKIKVGQTKTHELMIGFDNAGAPLQAIDAFQQGVMACAPSEWVCGSRALGEIAPTGTAWSSRFDAQMEKGGVSYIKARDARRDYGMMNYGDWWGERGSNWGNNEYDDPHVWLMHFARTGDMRAFMLGDRGAKHYGDVDCIHYHPDPRRVGAGYAHCYGHVGGFFQKRPLVTGTPTGGHSPCHTRTEGLVEHYLLTGDRRSLAAAIGIGEYYDGRWMNNYDFDNCRVPGWHIVLTMALYNTTGDPFYLNAAKIIGRRAIERESPGGGWRRNLVPGHCYCLPRHRGNAGFMVGVLLSGLKYYHQATGDSRALDAIVRGARYLIRETYDPVAKQFRYTTCPNSPKPSSTGNMACEGFAYAARLTNAPDLKQVTRDMVSDIIAKASSPSASAVRFVPRALWDLDQMGPRQYRVVAPQSAEVLALNENGEDFTVDVQPEAQVSVVSPSGKTLALNQARLVEAEGEKGIYRIRVYAAQPVRLITSLPAEALAVKDNVRLRTDGLLRVELFGAPKAKEMSVAVRGEAKGEYVARLIGPDEVEATALTWHVENAADWMRLKIPHRAGESGVEPWRFTYTLEINGPAGQVELRLDGMPGYISAPSGKSFCPAKPKAAFTVAHPLVPGGKAKITLDAAPSTDVDNDITEYEWTFEDGSQIRGVKVTKELKAQKESTGEIPVTLTVTDKWGFQDVCTQTVVTPPAWLLALDPKQTVLIEAENFSAQGGGAVQLFERVGTSGRMISYWHENIGHWLEWKVNAPKTGEYKVILKYATLCDDTQRDFKVDGVYPGEDFKHFHLPNTGGFCTTKNDWRYYTIGGEKTPAYFCLAAGEHTIRMTNLKDGCALDFILLVPR